MIEDQLADSAADLVEREEYHPFLERLFSQQAGIWESATVLCNDVVPIKAHLEQAQQQCVGTMLVTWLEYPHAASGKDYCLILFFAEDLHWSSVALYNKQWFLQKYAQRRHLGV